MSAKPETPAASSDASAAAAAPGGKPPSKLGALLPVILVVVLAPAVSWAVAQFVLLPQLKAELAKALPTAEGPAAAHAAGAAPAPEPAPAKPEKGHGGGKKGAPAAADASYTFENVVVNLAGTMGTRYLKTTFMVTGSDPQLRVQFEANRARLIDVSLNVLSSLTLADLEEPGAKNILRQKLSAAYNQALGRKVAEEIYFSDFVVQ